MPTYEFRCPAGHDFERFYRKISDGVAQAECPQCGQLADRRMSAGAGLLFKGSGFYITDYGKDGKKGQTSPTASGESGGGESSGAKSEPSGGDAKAPAKESKSETKPAAKPSKPASE